LFCSCDENRTSSNRKIRPKDSISTSEFNPVIRYDRLKEYLLSSDSVVLFSHHSPNEPIKNPHTGKYYPHFIPFIEKEKINYATSVQERNQLNKNGIHELTEILILPAVSDSINLLCFQPRNAVVVFKGGRISCFDFCFDCFGFTQCGDFDSGLIMNGEKYKKLFAFYKKHGFKYQMD
jgi:hypothetical protein